MISAWLINAWDMQVVQAGTIRLGGGGSTHIGGLLGEGLGVAGHGLALALIDVGKDALLMHGSQLVLLGVAFFLECLNRSLKLHSHIKTYCTPREKDYQHEF